MCIVLPTGLRQKYKAPGQVLRYYSVIHRSLCCKNVENYCAYVCNRAVIHMSEAGV